MGKEEVWIVPMAITELRERLTKCGQPLSAFGLLAEWRHFIENGRFAKKRHPAEVALLRKFEQKTREHFLKDDRGKLYVKVLAFFAERYAVEAQRETRT